MDYLALKPARIMQAFVIFLVFIVVQLEDKRKNLNNKNIYKRCLKTKITARNLLPFV
jgi:hypothetical protein